MNVLVDRIRVEGDKSHIILVEKSYGRRPLGSPKHTWEEKSKMFQGNWLKMVTVMNLLSVIVPLRNFLIS